MSGKDVKAEVVWSYLCNSCCFLSPLIRLHTLNAVTFCQQHLITSGILRDSCNTLSSLHISLSSVHRHYHTVILTTSVKTTCELTVTYQRKWHYKSWLTLWKSYCVCDTSFWKFSRVGSRCKETSEENNNNNGWARLNCLTNTDPNLLPLYTESCPVTALFGLRCVWCIRCIRCDVSSHRNMA